VTPGEAARRLAHDVGKYVARTARNLPPQGPLDGELVAMLARDLYELGAGRARASQVLDDLARPITEWRREETVSGYPNCLSRYDVQMSAARDRVGAARALLVEADALEARLRGGDAAAVARGAAVACEVETILRALARELR
jgi:hypothetical protein